VSFGGVAAAEVRVNSDTSITAGTPAHAPGTVDVTVTAPGGTSPAVTADHFTFAAAPTVTGINPQSGPTAGGTSVTISGSGFTGASAVSFDGTAATSFSVVSDTQIAATAPAHAAGTVDVTVTTPGGSSAPVSADHFTYVGAPVVTGVSPNSGPTTGGTFVTITGSGFTGTSAVSFGGTAAGPFSVFSDTQIVATSPAHAAGTVDITVTTPVGTSATSSADRFTFT
jgi:hypothetical protein